MKKWRPGESKSSVAGNHPGSPEKRDDKWIKGPDISAGGGRYGLILGHITGSKDCLYKGRVK